MEITTVEQAKEHINKWLTENHHTVKAIEDAQVSFHFEVDYPLGSQKRQRVLQPKDFPGLIVLLNGVSVANEHYEKLKKLTEKEREKFYSEIRNDLIFQPNSYDLNLDDQGIVRQIQFSTEFYLDGLTKTKLFEGLLINHRTLLYVIYKFNDKFGVPTMPAAQGGGEVVGNA